MQTAIEDRNLFETQFENLSVEKDSLITRVNQLENSLANSDMHVDSLNSQLENFKNNIRKNENKLEEYRLNCDRLATERDNLLIEKKHRAHELAEMNNKFIKAEQLAKKSKAGILTLDREKDAIQNLLDEKTETLYSVEKELRRTEIAFREVQLNNDNAKSYTQRVGEDVMNYQKEIVSLKKQVTNANKDYDKEVKQKEENFRLLDQTRSDLIKSEEDRRNKQIEIDDLNRNLVQNSTEIDRLNNLINSYKDKQISDSEDNKAWKNRCDLIEEERQKNLIDLSKARENLVLLESNCRSLQNSLQIQTETNNVQMSEINQHMKTISEFENVTKNLENCLSESRAKITELENTIKIYNDDMEHCREINARLQNEIDQQMCAHNDYRMRNEKAIDEVDLIKGALEMAKKELDEEKAHARELELLVQKARHKEFEMQLENSQMREELVHQKDESGHAKNQIKIYEKHLSEQLSKSKELESEVEKVKRLLVHERYERERTAQMLQQTKEQFNL